MSTNLQPTGSSLFFDELVFKMFFQRILSRSFIQEKFDLATIVHQQWTKIKTAYPLCDPK